MLNTAVARKALDQINTPEDPQDVLKALEVLTSFVNSVEQLMQKNSIKQTPAIFCPYDKLR